MTWKALRIPALGTLLTALALETASAATPASGTITESSSTLTYTGGPFLVSNPTPTPVSSAPTCNAATTCDAFALTVTLPADYAALHPDDYVAVRVDWESPLGDTARADLDLWVYKGATIFTSSASTNQPEIAYLPAVSGTYTLRVVPFHAQGETYTALVSLGPLPPTGIADALYRSSADVWSANLHLTGSGLSAHNNDLEPAVKMDPDGNAYVSSNGEGIGLWKISEPCGQTVASFVEPEAPLVNGGGDTDVEVAPVKNALGFYNLYTSSLHALDALVNFNSSVSMDGGATWVTTPISTANVVDDRQWNAAYGANTVYLSYHSVSGGFNIYLVRSDAGGLPGTFTGPYLVNQDVVFTSTLNNALGTMVADQRPTPPLTPPGLAGPNGEGNLYHGFVEGGNKLYVGVSHDFGVTWSSKLAHEGARGSNYAHMFSCVAVDRAGNVYTAFCDDRNIYYTFSTDQGEHWAPPRRVSNGPATKVSVFPALAAGSAGRIVLAWYGAQGRNADDPANQWQVFTARCQNALDSAPLFEQTLVSDHIIHTGRVCEQGTNCSGGRQLLDLFEMDIDPTNGSSFITYTNDTGGRWTNITRQLSGGSAIAGKSMTDHSLACPSSAPCPAAATAVPEGGEMTELEVRQLEFTVTNAGLAAGHFRYELQDALGWTIASNGPFTGITPALGAGESFTLGVDARAPATCPSGPEVYRWIVAGSGATCAPETATVELTCTTTTAVEGPGAAAGFGLGPAVPNPFDGTTTLAYRIPARGRVTVEVFAVSGRKVSMLLDQVCDAGPGRVSLSSRGLAPGIYMVRLRAAGRSQTRSVTVMR
ncbi:MAG TPA: T9SS type A sorting domain-containing protein [Candidatus Eisenbacteria bacterium]|jgi:hypothetical protein